MASRSRYQRGWAVAAVLVAVLCSQAPGGVITVNADGTGDYPTIQAAIDAAVHGDEVILLPGTYTGDGNRDIDYLGKAITVRGIEPNDPNVVAATVVNCRGTETAGHRGFFFGRGEGRGSVLRGLTITGGYLAGMGGAIYCVGTEPRIEHCIVTGNRTVGSTGAISVSGGSPLILGCTVTDNTAPGILVASGGATISHCTVSWNEGGGDGGGIRAYGERATVIENCVISHNRATNGGGVCGSSLRISNSGIYHNACVGAAGGIYIKGQLGENVIANCTIVDNAGSAIVVLDDTAILTNSIVWRRSSAPQRLITAWHIDSSSPAIDISYCDIAGGQGNTAWMWGPGNITSDPCFADWGHWEDPLGTPADPTDDVWIEEDYHLKSQAGRWDPVAGAWVNDTTTSFCIDAGDPNSDASAEPSPSGSRINMGMYGGTAEASKSFYGPQRVGVSPQQLAFFGEVSGANPAAQTLSIVNVGEGTLDWEIVHDCNWLTVDPNAGHVIDGVNDVRIAVDIDGVRGGAHECVLLIIDPWAANSPQNVLVCLTLEGPVIEASTRTVRFTNDYGGPNPFDQFLSLRNSGIGTLHWEIEADCDWLSIYPKTGTSTGESDEVRLSVDTAGLHWGLHSCTLQIVDDLTINSPLTIEVQLEVLGPILRLSTHQMTFNGAVGQASPDPKSLVITNGGPGPLDWRIDEDCGWLSVIPSTGSLGREQSEAVILAVDSSGLGNGVHRCNAVVSGVMAEDSPQTVQVELVLGRPSIQLSTNHLTFMVQPGAGRPSDQALVIRNAGVGMLQWEVRQDCDWVVVDPLHGTSTGEGDAVMVGVDPSGLAQGRHICTLEVVDPCASNNPQQVVVELIYGPVVRVLPQTLQFIVEPGAGNPAPQTIRIENAGTGVLHWTVSAESAWVAAEPSAGTIATDYAEVAVHIDAGGLTKGQHLCRLTVSDPCGISSPQIVNVHLNIYCMDPASPYYNTWVKVGAPECWCYPWQCHGDVDGRVEGSDKTGYYRVHFNDLNTLLAAWNKKEPTLGPGLAGCSFQGTPCICADFDRGLEGSMKSGTFRVRFNDLNILLGYWNVKEPPHGPGIPGNCGGTLIP